MHPDQLEAATQLGDAFGRALGSRVKVTPRGAGYRVSVTFDSLEEAFALVDRLDPVGDPELDGRSLSSRLPGD